MGQSKLASMIETVTNTLVGYLIAVWMQSVIFPMFGYNLPLHDNFIMAGIFTVVSILRSYFFRRLFNASPWRKFKERS